MDTAHWPVQGIGNGKNAGEKRPRPPKEHVMSCPRCSSTNTKFCYYNNYSLSQPRYFCKACRRYWTHGGSLRNVPVGGGSRKHRRPSSSSSSPVPAVKELGSSVGLANLDPVSFAAQNHGMIHVGHDLNLACDPVRSYSMGVPEYVTFDLQNPSFSSAAAAVHQLPERELLKEGNFMGPSPGYDSSSGGIPGFKQNLGFLCDGFGDLQGVHEDHQHPANCSSRNLFFPFVDHSKQVAANGDPPAFEHEKGETNGFWSGMLAGGSPR